MASKKKRPEPLDTSAITKLKDSGGSGYLPQDEATKLANAGLIEIHPTAKDANGNPAVRLTLAGTTFAGNPNGETMTETQTVTSADVGKVPASVMTFEIEDNIPMPARRAGGNTSKAPKYPFEALQVGQSFHIAATAAIPQPWKKFSSIASSASRKYATKEVDANGQPIMVTRTRKVTNKETGAVTEKTTSSPKLKMTRKFAIRPASADDKKGPGARVWREA